MIIRQLQDNQFQIDTPDLPDYKFFCFSGKPRYCQVISGRNTEEVIDFYDKDWIHQPFHEPKKYRFADVPATKPKHLEEMWDIAKQLSQCSPFLRVDFYEIRDKVFFGEITFFPTSGYGGFDPEEWDYKFGSWINLDNLRK